MRRVTLLFPDTNSLWAFAQTLQSSHIQINSTERKLAFDCSEADVSKAILQYNATILDETEQRSQR